MGRRYSVDGQDINTAGTSLGYIKQPAAAVSRISVYDLILGSDAVAADNAFEYVLQRLTNDHLTPGGSAITPQALDPSDPAASAEAVEAPTGEPTYTAGAILLQIPLNQRATFRWVAAPGGELIIPDTNDNGIGLQVISISASAVNANFCMHFYE